MEEGSLPMQSAPHDTLRYGLSSLKEDLTAVHPVQALERNYPRQQWNSREKMLQTIYGSALPARLQIERQILGRVQRLPGLPSSQLGLESLTGELDNFEVSSYLAASEQPEGATPDLHSTMEARLGMSAKPPSRGLP